MAPSVALAMPNVTPNYAHNEPTGTQLIILYIIEITIPIIAPLHTR